MPPVPPCGFAPQVHHEAAKSTSGRFLSKSMGSRLQAIGAAVVSLVVSGACCCAGGSGIQTTSSPSSAPSPALIDWQDFPANQVPRPIVLFHNFLALPAHMTEESRLSAGCGKFGLAWDVPTEVVPNQASVTWSDGTSATYAARSAGDVFAEMTNRPPSNVGGCAYASPAVATAVRYGTAPFATDRGVAQMSAWLFTVTGMTEEWAYPAISRSAFWRGGTTFGLGRPSTVSGNGLALTNAYYTDHPAGGPCADTNEALVAESTSAVEIDVRTTHSAPASCARTSLPQLRFITVLLKSPLGGRVVVNGNGYVEAVCPGNTKPGQPPCAQAA